MIGNILQNIPENLPEELFTQLLEADGVKVERIVSDGQVSPPDFWYDQPQSEWVLLLEGEAHLSLEKEKQVEKIILLKGDYLLILPHQRHRIDFTHSTQKTIWLAIHF